MWNENSSGSRLLLSEIHESRGGRKEKNPWKRPKGNILRRGGLGDWGVVEAEGREGCRKK